MNSLYILLPIALLFTLLSLAAFVWAVSSRQYDDLDAAGESILFDEDEKADEDMTGEALEGGSNGP